MPVCRAVNSKGMSARGGEMKMVRKVKMVEMTKKVEKVKSSYQ